MKYHIRQHDYNTLKLLALIVATGLIFSATMSAITFAEESKKVDSSKDIKKKHVKAAKQKITEKKSFMPAKAASTEQAAPLQTPTPKVDPMQEKIQACKAKKTQREQYECEKALRTDDFKSKATKTVIGPITFYSVGATVEQSSGKDIVNLRFLVENTGSKENVSLYCTGPAVCNYDVSDGTTTYKYSANDFTNGQIVIMPGKSRMFNMLFGPAIGYGSYVDFKFDPSKQYTFNVKEPWGSGSIPLNLK